MQFCSSNTSMPQIIRIAHFVTDEKFIDDMIASFEAVLPGCNLYYLFSKKLDNKLKFIKSNKIVIVNERDIDMFLSSKLAVDIIIIHNLLSIPYQYIPTIPKSIKVVWFSWGFDIYSNKLPKLKLARIPNRVKRDSLLFSIYLKNMFNEIREHFYYHKYNLLHGKYAEEKLFKDAIRRIDFYSGVFPLEYDIVSKNNYFNAKQVFFNYPGKKGTFNYEDVYNLPIVGDDIQIGQSASPLLNHVSALKVLRKVRIRERKIIVPLSYQNEEWYVNYVCKVGEKLYGNHFMPLKDFMPLDRYSDIMRNVGIAIFYIMQQSAVGNILMALWNGAKVFLPKASLNYKHFRDLGFVIFPIEEINQSMIDEKLTSDEIITNRRKISELYSYESLIVKIENFIKTVYDTKKNT